MERFTPRAQTVLANAREEAERLHLNYVDSEHVLFGLIKMDKGVAANVLKNLLGLRMENVRAEIEKWGGWGKGEKMFENIPFTPRTMRVFEMAKEEANGLGHTYIGTEHLLLGLLHEKEELAADIFNKFCVDIEQVRTTILEELNPNFSPGDDTQKNP